MYPGFVTVSRVADCIKGWWMYLGLLTVSRIREGIRGW